MSDQRSSLETAIPGPPQGDSLAYAPGEPTRLLAFSHRASHLRLWISTAAGLALDLWTKSWAFSEAFSRQEIIPGVLSFERTLNRGALWGMGKSLGSSARWVFVAASVFAVIFVLYVFGRSARTQRSFHVGLGLVLGGALGNLYDRLFNNGLVRDFIKIDLQVSTLKLWPWIFNVADVLLVVGVGLLLMNIWKDRSKPC